MTLLSPKEIEYYQPLLEGLEAEEPLVSAWRRHATVTPVNGGIQKWRIAFRRFRDRANQFRRVERPGPGQVVVLSYSREESARGTLLPLMTEMKKRGIPSFLVTSRDTRSLAADNLHQGTVDFETLIQNVDRKAARKIQRRARDLSSELKRVLTDGKDNHSEYWLSRGLLVHEAAMRWLRRDVVVVGDSDMEIPRKAAFLAAQGNNIPTGVLQHGLFGSHQFPLHADHLFCWGEYFKKMARQFDLSAKRILTTGCPRWDMLVKLRTEGRRDPCVRNALGGCRERPLVLLISNAHSADVYPDHYQAYFMGVERLLESDMDVVVKLHPAEKDLSAYKKALGEGIEKRLHVVPGTIGLHAALFHSDVVYHMFSAAALEAMLLGVPVLFERAGDAPKMCDLPDHGGGQWVEAADTVETCRVLGRDGRERQELLTRQDEFIETAFSNLGRATGATVDRILALRSLAG